MSGSTNNTNGTGSVAITRVVLRNYRSIAGCDVKLGALTFLVGPNGSGKSNFLDALQLVSDALRTSLDHALRDRGGIDAVRRRSSGRPNDFSIRIEFQVNGELGHLAFTMGAQTGGVFAVKAEECRFGDAYYLVKDGQIAKTTAPVAPPASNDRLYLVLAAGLKEFRPVFDLLSTLGTYNLNPNVISELQQPDKGDLLARDGRNLSSVLEHLEKDLPETKARIDEYLSQIVPGLVGVSTVRVGHMETLEFMQRVKGAQHPWRFPAINMSDGTLRALAVLVAVFQSRGEGRVKLVGLEEPEVALHPAASGLLRDALREAARGVQIIVTSHSPELLDDEDIGSDDILAVMSVEGNTFIARVDEATRSILKDNLYTVGELLRSNQLAPDVSSVQEPRQMKLFGERS